MDATRRTGRPDDGGGVGGRDGVAATPAGDVRFREIRVDVSPLKRQG